VARQFVETASGCPPVTDLLRSYDQLRAVVSAVLRLQAVELAEAHRPRWELREDRTGEEDGLALALLDGAAHERPGERREPLAAKCP
jgi:hypothetical protein